MNQRGRGVPAGPGLRGDGGDVVRRSSPARSTASTSPSSPPSPSSSSVSSSSSHSSPARSPQSSPTRINRINDVDNGQRGSRSKGRALLVLGLFLTLAAFSLVRVASSIQVLSYRDGRGDGDSATAFKEAGPPDRRSIDSSTGVSTMPLNKTASSSSNAGGEGAATSAGSEDGGGGSDDGAQRLPAAVASMDGAPAPAPPILMVAPHPRISTLHGAPSKNFTSSFFRRTTKKGLLKPKTRRKVDRMYDPKLVNAGARKPLNGLFNNGEEQEMDGQECVPMQEWQSSLRPSCNTLHEIDMSKDDDGRGSGTELGGDGELKRLGEGGWRDAWQLTRTTTTDPSPQHDNLNLTTTNGGGGETDTETVILKTLWGRTERPYDALSYEMHRIDAAASERLTGSPRVVDVYGHCGQSVLNEAADRTLEDLMETDGEDMDMEGRVRHARDVALAVAAVHTADGGVGDNATVVHRDIKMDNIVLVDGRIKVNDFNSAVLLTRDENTSGGRCKIRRNWQVPWFQSHGEFPFTEKVDVLCLGGLLYYVLTGGRQPYQGYDLERIARKFERGEMPKVPKSLYKRWDRSNVDANVVLRYVQIMDKCFRKEAQDRPNASDVARELDVLLRNVTTTSQKGGRGGSEVDSIK